MAYIQLFFNPLKQRYPTKSGTYLGPKRVFLKPERNVLTEDQYNSVKDLGVFQEMIKSEAIVIVGQVSPSEPSKGSDEGLLIDGKFVNLLSLNKTESKAEAAKEIDPVVLNRWLVAEQGDGTRPTVVAAIEQQLAKVGIE